MSQGFQFKPEAPNIAKHREYVLKYFKKRLGTALGKRKNAKRRRRKFCVLVCTKKKARRSNTAGRSAAGNTVNFGQTSIP